MNMPLTNYGIFGQTIDGNAGFYWPSGFPNETYIFGAGIWVGGLVRKANDPTKFDTQLTCGYNPNSGLTEFVPGEPGHSNDPDQKIYFSSDSDWPLKDAQGKDSVLSILDSYCAYNDYDSTHHFVPENKPLDITVIQQTYSFRGKSYDDIIIFIYNIVLNDTSDTVHDAFIGICADNDIGNESGSAANDLVGFDRERNMAFQWQNDSEPGWTHFPGTIAYKFLQGPPSNGVDTVHYYKDPYDTTKTDSIVIHPDDTLGMTAFKIFTIAIDPADKYERYQEMSGYSYKTLDPQNPEDSYNPYDVDVYGPSDKRFLQSAGPFNLIPGDTAKVIFAIIMAKDTSDLPMKADAAQAIFDGGWTAPMPPAVPDLFGVPGTNKVTLYWENNPEITPDRFSCITSKDSVLQNGQTVANPFYNPKYRDYDFEGYKVWKSIYPDPSTFQMIAHFDKDDSLQILRQDSLYDINGDSFVIIKAETLGFDNGLSHTFIDMNIPYSNITYYYAVTAYDANYFGYTVDSITGDTIGTDPISFKSRIADNMIAVVPDNQQNFITEPYSTIIFENGNQLLPYANVVYPDGVPIVNDILDDSTVYHLRFGPITIGDGGTPIYSFYVDTVSSERYLPQDTLGNPFLFKVKTESINSGSTFIWKSICPVSFPLYGALICVDSITVNPSNNRVDSIIINDAVAYTDTLLLTDSTPYGWNYPHIQSHPCYNGGSYKISWHVVGDSALTCDVYDMVNGIDVPYSPNWDFGWRFGKKDSTSGGGQGKYMFFSDSTADNWKAMYIDGVSIFFNYHANATPPIPSKRILPMSQANKPAEGDTWYIYNTACPTPSIGNSFKITFTKGTIGIYDQLEHSKLDNVTVAPNPYLISSSKNINEKRKGVMFKGLPKKCDISIYSLNGSLIDRIEHRSSADNVIDYWNVDNNPKLKPISGIYFYMVETIDRRYHKSGKIVLIR